MSLPVPQLPTSEDRFQCAVCHTLLNGPLQVPCCHRICTPCGRKLKQQKAQAFFCGKCKTSVAFMNYFYDKEMSKEIDYLVVSCPYCSAWNGEYKKFQTHLKEECQLVKVSCPNEGCHEETTRSQLDDHLQQCQYRRQSYQWYKEEVPYDQQKNVFMFQSHALRTLFLGKKYIDLHLDPNNQLGYSMAKKKINRQQTQLQCLFSFLGCQFIANMGSSELETHLERYVKHHLSLVGKFLSDGFHQKQTRFTSKEYEAMNQLLHVELDKTSKKLEAMNDKNKEETLQITGIQRKQDDVIFRLTGVEDLLVSLQASINEINHTYEEVSLTLQTLQATSYDGHYIWKIPDITRRRRDALLGKTVSLYSAPFYTSRFGYRLCLRVYLDGDGSGKGRYISYFLTIMKGEYDALLEWPFQHTVTMTLVNQKGNNNIVQSFRPNPTSTSFHRPKSDMNVASGCPKFAPLSILDNPEFAVDDVAFFKCDIRLQ
ncbi:TNF receptor-associated factor 5-like isoform X2 [Dysidea avara]|uniref:TNF receptor-associated factor 5-like isoform X2 n=1 Tax=Dysidea avara TaxID=196820 RepID=UPI00331EF008